jgi:hypothetical protein
MTKQKTGSGTRRGFLARLAAVGTVLGGIVPELRAQTATSSDLVATPDFPPAPPLSPSSTAILFAQAQQNPYAKKLLSEAGPNLVASTPDYSYDLGSQGKHITIPLRNATTGELTAYIYYALLPALDPIGNTVSANLIFSIRSNGSMHYVDYTGAIVPGPPETETFAAVFHQTFLPNQFSAMPPLPRRVRPSGAYLACEREYRLCLRRASELGGNLAGITTFLGGLLRGALIPVLPGTPAGPLAVPALLRSLGNPISSSGSRLGSGLERSWLWLEVFKRQAACRVDFETCLDCGMCLSHIPPEPSTSPPTVSQGMPIPPMASPPGVPPGMPTPPFTPPGPGGKF